MLDIPSHVPEREEGESWGSLNFGSYSLRAPSRSLLSFLSCGGSRMNVVAMTFDLTPIFSSGYRASGH